jgi:hypothetical protein
VDDYSEVVLNAMGAAPTMGLSFGDDEKRLKNLFSDIEEDRYRADGVSASNTKGKTDRGGPT